MATIGISGTLNYKLDGQADAGAWAELVEATDVTLSIEADEIDATSRANGGWKGLIPGLKSATVETSLVYDASDTTFGDIKDAFLADQMVGLQVLEGDTGQGLQGDFRVFSFGREEQMGDVMKVPVTFKTTKSDTAPSWVTVS